ncbi:copper amine oxidase N-terminal domain-containing protein, partial [bacterium]|nr:copper amine oxidase N-terminal domain-containing protein [bacterium]
SGTAKWEATNRELTVGATLQATDQERWDDLRLFCVLAEHGVLFDAENGMKEHHYVVRDLLALPNPERSDAYGSPITGEEGSTQLQKNESWCCHLQTTVDPLVKMENTFCILFVQDIMTKQVYQSRFVPLTETIKPVMIWITERETVALSQDKAVSAKAWLVNRGNLVDQFRLEIFNQKPFMGNDTWKINGKEYPVSQTVSVLLNPMETALVELSLAPGWGESEPSSIELKATNSSRNEQYGRIQTTSLENKSRYQVLFPDTTILEETTGWTTDLYTFNCVLKTEPGTVLEGKVPIKAGPDGIMILPSDTLGNCIGKNSWSVTLRYPDTTSELITFYFTRSLYIDLTIGSKEVVLNHAKVLFAGAPFIRKNRTIVPFMDIIDCFACGFRADWDSRTREITIFIGDDVISFQVGVPFGKVNDREVPLDASPEIVKNVIYTPLRFFAEALGAKVEWEAKTQTVRIREPSG